MIKQLAAIALGASTLAAAPAAAQSDGVAALVQANNSLQAKIDAAGEDRAPTLRNGDAALVSKAFDASAIRALPVDLSVANVCTALGNAIVSYANYAGRVGGGEAAADQYLLSHLQEEMTLAFASANLCIARTYRAAIPVVQKMPAGDVANAKGALRQMRDGAVQTLSGTMEMAPRMTPAHAMVVLDAVNEEIGAIAASIAPADRKQLAQLARSHIATAPAAIHAKLNMIAAAFDRTECNILCESISAN